jgi:hypothetical protein
MMQVEGCSEKSVAIYKLMCHHTPEEINNHWQSCENIKSCIFLIQRGAVYRDIGCSALYSSVTKSEQ